jgi:multidrug efflux pump subunit AcrA (membrane-fusion protein)
LLILPLLRIDPIDYALALGQARAGLAELDIQERNAQTSLAIEERNLKLAGQDVERKRKLMQKGTASRSNVDEAERVMLSSRMAVQTLRNTLALIPTQRSVLVATVDRVQRDLERTEIRAPFTLRVADLAIEANQYVGVGQSLFEGDDVKSDVDAIDDFPDQTEPPVVSELGRTEPVISVAVTGPEDPVVLKAYAEDLKDQMMSLEDIAEVTVTGFSDHHIRIEIPVWRLRQYALSADDVANSIGRHSVSSPANASARERSPTFAAFV